jgi:molybdopterin converting factor small subunit
MEVSALVKYSSFRKQLQDKDFGKITLKKGTTAGEFLDQLDIPEYYLNKITINGVNQSMDTILSDGDDIVVWPPRIGAG